MQTRTLTRREFLAASGGALAGVSALGLAGCGGGSGGGPLNILAGQSTSFPKEQEAWLENMSKQLQKAAGTGLEWDFYADAETEQRKLQTAMTSGTGLTSLSSAALSCRPPSRPMVSWSSPART